MRSRTNERFRKAFAALPEEIQRKAREAYARWHEDSSHPSLQYKKIHDSQPIHAVRIALGWRAIGVVQGDEMTGFWIGSHAGYDKLLGQLRRKAWAEPSVRAFKNGLAFSAEDSPAEKARCMKSRNRDA